MVIDFPKNPNAKALEDIYYQEIYNYLTKEREDIKIIDFNHHHNQRKRRKVSKEIKRLFNVKRWAG